MKNVFFSKKALAFLLAALLTMTCFLASCQQEGADASSETETIQPPTHAELFWEALCTLETYFDPMESTFGMPLFSSMTSDEDGTETATLSIDQLAAMGVSMIGDQPVRKETVTKNKGGVINTVGTWFAAGDEIKFEEYSDENLQYLLLPGVQDTPFTAAAGGLASLTDMEAGGIPNGVLEALEASVKELFTDEMILIAKSDVVDTYTITMDPETAKAFDDVLDKTMADSGLTDLLGTGDLMNDEGVEVSGGTEKTMVLVLNVAAGKNYQLKLSVLENGAEIGVTKFAIAVNGAVTTLQYSVTEGTTVTDEVTCTFTVAASSMKVEATMVSDGDTTTADLTLTADEAKKLTYKGDINTTSQVEGMSLSIPIAINGTYQDTEAGVVTTLSLSASIAGFMDLAVTTESTFVSGTPEVVAPQQGVDIKEMNMTELMAKMESTYPGATALYNSLMGLTDPETGLFPQQ